MSGCRISSRSRIGHAGRAGEVWTHPSRTSNARTRWTSGHLRRYGRTVPFHSSYRLPATDRVAVGLISDDPLKVVTLTKGLSADWLRGAEPVK